MLIYVEWYFFLYHGEIVMKFDDGYDDIHYDVKIAWVSFWLCCMQLAHLVCECYMQSCLSIF